MRHRPLITASLLLMLLAGPLTLAACGGDDDPQVAVEASTATSAPAPSDASDPSGEPGKDTPALTGPPPQQADGKTLPSAIAVNEELKTFNTALIATGALPTLLDRAGPYTVFAPSDDAFTKLGSDLDTLLQPASRARLNSLLRFHIVAGTFGSKELKNGDLLTTLQGTRLRVKVDGDQISVGNSLGSTAIVSSDVPATNGTIHVVDTVLEPKEAVAP